MQIVLAMASLAVILLHEYVTIIGAGMGAATLAVAAGPAILSYLNRKPSKSQKESSEQQYIPSDAPEVKHRSTTHDGTAIRRDTGSDRQMDGDQIV